MPSTSKINHSKIPKRNPQVFLVPPGFSTPKKSPAVFPLALGFTRATSLRNLGFLLRLFGTKFLDLRATQGWPIMAQSLWFSGKEMYRSIGFLFKLGTNLVRKGFFHPHLSWWFFTNPFKKSMRNHKLDHATPRIGVENSPKIFELPPPQI